MHSSRLSPIHSLPEELGLAILKEGYEHHFPHCRLDTGLPLYSPIPISQVNRWWRRLALSLREIWACIHLTVDQPARMQLDAIIGMYLHRSRDIPIGIFFSCYTSEYDEHPTYTGEWSTLSDCQTWRRYDNAWGTLLSQQERWKNIYIHVLHSEAAVELLSYFSPGGNLPLLEFFGIALWPENDHEWFPDYAQLSFMVAPKLTRFHTTCIDVTGSRAWRGKPHPFSHLTELMFSDMCLCPTSFLHTLAATSMTLETLILSQIDFDEHSDDDGTPLVLTLPRLRALFLDEITEEHSAGVPIATTICRSAPILAKLYLASQCSILECVLDGRLSFPTVRGLACVSLFQELQVGLPNATFLLAFPGLETLSLDEPWAIVETCLAEAARVDVAAGDGQCVVWTALQTLVVSGDAGTCVALGTFALHRSQRGHPLRDIQILSSSVDQEELLATVQGIQPAPRVIRRSTRVPFVAWDHVANKPSITPWDGSLDVEDQF